MRVVNKLSAYIFLSVFFLIDAFVVLNSSHTKSRRTLLLLTNSQSHDGHISRRHLFEVVSLLMPAVLVVSASPARADVWDGNALPQGAQQFSRVIKLKTDLKVSFVSLTFVRTT